MVVGGQLSRAAAVDGAGCARSRPALAVALAVSGCSGLGSAATGRPVRRRGCRASARTPPSGQAGLARFYDQQLDVVRPADGFQCATLTVPLDYAKPDGATDLASRCSRPAAKGDRRSAPSWSTPAARAARHVQYARGARTSSFSAPLREQLRHRRLRPARHRLQRPGRLPRATASSTPTSARTRRRTRQAEEQSFVAAPSDLAASARPAPARCWRTSPPIEAAATWTSCGPRWASRS